MSDDANKTDETAFTAILCAACFAIGAVVTASLLYFFGWR
jgi:hypothetical protein